MIQSHAAAGLEKNKNLRINNELRLCVVYLIIEEAGELVVALWIGLAFVYIYRLTAMEGAQYLRHCGPNYDWLSLSSPQTDNLPIAVISVWFGKKYRRLSVYAARE